MITTGGRSVQEIRIDGSRAFKPTNGVPKINATLPKDIEPTSVDLETAVRLISEKSKKGPTKKKKRKK